MDDEEAMLAAALVQPGVTAPLRSYLAWLDERAARAEYLRLLRTALDDPTTPSPRGPVRERLHQLRRKITPLWADRVDRARLLTAGLYQSDPTPEGVSYLRFDDGPTLIAGISTDAAAETWRRMNANTSAAASPFHRTTYTLRADDLSFTLPFDPPAALQDRWKALMDEMMAKALVEDFDYIAADADVRRYQSGLIESMKQINHTGAVGDRVLCLQWRSAFAGSYGGVTTYRFVDMTAA